MLDGWFDPKKALSEAKERIEQLLAMDEQHKSANLALICERDQLLQSSKIGKNEVQPVRHTVRQRAI